MYVIKPMDLKSAQTIVSWTYDPPYTIYSMEDSQESIDELMDGEYYPVIEAGGELVGYFCFGTSAQVPAGHNVGAYTNAGFLDIGLGLDPALCGGGRGLSFMQQGLDFAREKLGAKGFRLTVATFNQRAIKTYERSGFKKTVTFTTPPERGSVEFVVMTRQ